MCQSEHVVRAVQLFILVAAAAVAAAVAIVARPHYHVCCSIAHITQYVTCDLGFPCTRPVHAKNLPEWTGNALFLASLMMPAMTGETRGQVSQILNCDSGPHQSDWGFLSWSPSYLSLFLVPVQSFGKGNGWNLEVT